MSDKERKVAVVTGGSRGIGRAIVLALSRMGLDVICNYRSGEEAAKETARLAEGSAGQVFPVKFDVADREEVRDAFKGIIKEKKRLDVLVNNAGITRDNLVAMMKPAQWDDVISTNLSGVFYCCQAVTRQMLKQRYGRIVNITSVIGFTGNAGQANYAAAKAGIVGLTRSLAKELASRNITVNAVAPGYIETDMTSGLPEDAREAMLQQIPLGRVGTPEDVAGAVKFLVSDKASYITGQIIHVNGGMFMG